MFYKLAKALKKKDGFTLVELMVVVVIIGILAAIAVPQFTGMKEKAENAAEEANLRIIDSAIEMYYAENGDWPNDLTSDLEPYIADMTDLDGYNLTGSEPPVATH